MAILEKHSMLLIRYLEVTVSFEFECKPVMLIHMLIFEIVPCPLYYVKNCRNLRYRLVVLFPLIAN